MICILLCSLQGSLSRITDAALHIKKADTSKNLLLLAHPAGGRSSAKYLTAGGIDMVSKTKQASAQAG